MAKPETSSIAELLASPSPAERALEMAAAAYVPAFVAEAGPRVCEAFIDFFAAQLTNLHTRRAYARAILLFERACHAAGLTSIAQARALHVAAYRDRLGSDLISRSGSIHA